MPIEDAALSQSNAHYAKAQQESKWLREAINGAIQRQAKRWGIRFDQAQALLLDRKAVA